jgi:hypothetical protein
MNKKLNSLNDDPVGTLPGVRDVFATVLETVTAGITSAAKGVDLDGIPLLQAILMGIVRATGRKEEAGLKILAHAAKTAVHHTADRGGNLAAATKGLVLGAIASAKTLGVDTAKSATAAAQGAIEGAAEAGSVTVERVLAALRDPIGGAKVEFVTPRMP